MAQRSGQATRGRTGGRALPHAADGGTWVVDLDGVVWLAGEPIPGAAGAVDRLRSAGAGVLFVSNNSSPTVGELVARLRRAGIEASAADIVTSAQAAASMVSAGTRVLVVGDGGIVEALEARGAVATPGTDGAVDVDVVMVGWTRRFDFGLLALANRAVRGGARLIGTNEDPTHPTPDGLLPGAGSLLAAVATAAGTVPEVAGKPHAPLVALVEARADRVAAVVGDRPSTDGVLARRLGVPFALVLSGVTAPGSPTGDPAPDFVADDIAGVADAALASG